MTRINVQTYSFMDGGDYDNEKVFRAAKEIGFDGVELFGPNFMMDPTELKALLTELDLPAISMHAPSSDEVERMIPYAKAMDLEFIGIGMQNMLNDDEVHAFAKKLNELGEKCHAEGLMLTYHNHTQEFLPCDDTFVLDVLMKETNPKFVGFEIDAGWVAAAGYDPIEIINRYAGRVKLIHIKESDSVIGPQEPLDWDSLPKDETGFPIFTEEQKANMNRNRKLNCPAGKGIVDWAKLKEVADAQGCKHYSVERELTPDGFETRYDSLKFDLEYYKSVM